MSMSQEEIEALMSGAGDIAPDTEETVEESNEAVVETEEKTPVIEDVSDEESAIDNENLDDILAGIDGIVDDGSDASDDSSDDQDIDAMLAGIDGIVDDSPAKEESVEETPIDSDTAKNMEELIDSNQYPLPVKNENKVVNQLNQVADDSEEKASQIFDVLSFILDENNDIQNYNNKMGEFIQNQAELLTSLSAKFPNIDIFATNLETAKQLIEDSKDLSSKIDSENNKVFEAMELMQYHDINRQKIERVMAVIRKLNSYLNGIFEDESDKAEVQIAKHISGDSNEVVDADDLESLISEFANEG